MSVLSWAKKTLEWMSLSRDARFVEMLLVVIGGVQMNFIPSPRTFLAMMGTICHSVRSWKVECQGWVAYWWSPASSCAFIAL
jgi:hypothetical protein